MAQTYTELKNQLIALGIHYGEYLLKNDNALDDVPTGNLGIGSIAYSPTGTFWMYDGDQWVMQ